MYTETQEEETRDILAISLFPNKFRFIVNKK